MLHICLIDQIFAHPVLKAIILFLLNALPCVALATGIGPPNMDDRSGMVIGILFFTALVAVPLAYAALVRKFATQHWRRRCVYCVLPFCLILIGVSGNAHITAKPLMTSFLLFVVLPAGFVEWVAWMIGRSKTNQSSAN